jgi:methylenetetrahydrofolate/methylenetetrahydromethanopterin dehydrogenase (NADP+)
VEKRKILIQIDSDPLPSVFDRIVGLDAGADEVLSYGGVKPEAVREIVHGAIFTRGPKDLVRTAIFVGGSDVAAGERLLQEACKHMLPHYGLRVSIMLDANGANTTAAAAVQAARQHLDLANCKALVLGGTGPVGQRVARLLAGLNAEVSVASRQVSRSEAVCQAIRARLPLARIDPVGTGSADELAAALTGRSLVVAAGAAGVVLLPRVARASCPQVKVLIDLNAVPPLGIEGIEPGDRGVLRDDVTVYGALGIGAAKMKLHKAAIARLFESNDQVLDAEEIFALAGG